MHDFWYTSDDKLSGKCIASWLHRKNVKCKWRRISADCDYSNDDDDVDDSDDEEETSGQSGQRTAPRVPFEDDNTAESEEESDDDQESANEEDCWWEMDDSDTDDDDNDEDYSPRIKRRRDTRIPCDETEAMVGQKKIVIGRTYEKRVGEDIWLVKVAEFVGRKARCQILFYLHAAIQDCFPRVSKDHIRQDRRWAFTEAIRGQHFLESLAESSEDFDQLCQFAEFDLKHDREEKIVFELQRRRLRVPSPHLAMRNGAPRELVLFAGIGGCSIGDKQAGFDVSWLVEQNSLCAASLKTSHPESMVYEEDVCTFLDKCEAKRDGYPTPGDAGEVDHLQSSSPCNGFSKLNRGGQHDEYNNSLSMQTVRATEIFKPRTGMLENVTGMMDSKHLHHVVGILQGLADLDYQVRIAVHDSCNFGAPQRRRRVIFTFARGDVRLPSMPIQTHTISHRTLDNAIGDLKDISCEMDGSGVVKLPNGSVTFNHVAARPTKATRSLSLNEPVNTMTTQNRFFHPVHPHRTLSVREQARLFDLPDDKQFFGSLTSMQKQIGNSVRPFCVHLFQLVAPQYLSPRRFRFQ